MVDLPVPPLPVTKCKRALVKRAGQPGLPGRCSTHLLGALEVGDVLPGPTGEQHVAYLKRPK
ncbi:hypothetical protein MAHJHV50_49650 [Mycobacterium avium subsp. hominissuis]